MVKKLLLACHLLAVAFLVKFFDADSDCDSDSGDSDSGDSDSGGSESGNSSGDISENSAWESVEIGGDASGASIDPTSSSGSESSNNSSPSSQRRPRIIPTPEDLQNLNPQDLSQIPRRNSWD